MRRGRIEKELGGKVIGRNIVLHHAEDLTARERRLLLLDAEFRFDQQARFLGRSDARPVHAFFYRGEREKKKLMGAGQTQYADIANHEMHMNYESPPIPVLKHEIVHVLSGPWGMSGLGFSKVLGITEGLAVASEIWRDEDAIPYWAAAMKAVGRLPDLAAISGPTGFWRLSGSRSYLAWGGFITWLIENYSMDHVRRVYGSADWDGIFGQDLPGLVAAWEKSLDELDVPPRLLRTAAYKYFRKSLFESKNARSVGRLTDDAERAARRGRYLLSGREYARAVDLSGGGSRYRDDLVDVLFAARRYDDAWNEAQKIVDMEGRDLGKEIGPGEVVRGDLAAAVRALATQAAVAWLRGDHLGARLLYQRVLDADVFWSLNRESAVALYALDHPEIEPDLRRYMVDPDARPAAEFLLHRAIEKMPDSGVLHYLLGRRLSVARLVDDAAAEFSLAIDLGLPTYDLRVKNFF
ncbi:MAG: hypothetical protein M5R36_12690 [Deltaproteobacteria bacterium]|nr:hypothetical protein [Deltaproteobacteria bacterium]